MYYLFNIFYFFQVIDNIIMGALKEGLGEAFTNDVGKAWGKMLSINIKIMADACENAAN